MSIAAIALFAALNGTPVQDAPPPPRPETRSEVRIVTMGGPGRGDGPARLDTDGNGVVTREEFSAPMGAAFDRLDANHDGRLSTEELAAHHAEGPEGLDGPGPHVMMLRAPGGPDGPGGPGGGAMMLRGGGEGDTRVFTFERHGPEGGPDRGPGAGRPGERRVEVRRFGGPGGHEGMDTDNDGKVSEAEFLAPLREAFQTMDTNHDGSLEEGESRMAPPPAPPAPPAPPVPPSPPRAG